MKAYPSFFAWRNDQSVANQKIIDELTQLVESIAPHFMSGVKWGQGCWIDGESPRIYVHAEDDHVQLGFYNGSSLKDPHRLLTGNGKYVRFVKVYDPASINTDGLAGLIAQVK